MASAKFQRHFIPSKDKTLIFLNVNVYEGSCKVSYHTVNCGETHTISEDLTKLCTEDMALCVLDESYQHSLTFKFHSFEKQRGHEL
jgi:hypothetical protein